MTASSWRSISQSMAFRRSGRDRVTTTATREVPSSPPTCAELGLLDEDSGPPIDTPSAARHRAAAFSGSLRR